VPVVDPGIQFALDNGEISSRHRVLNNLPGTRAFRPLAYKTVALDAFFEKEPRGSGPPEALSANTTVSRASQFPSTLVPDRRI